MVDFSGTRGTAINNRKKKLAVEAAAANTPTPTSTTKQPTNAGGYDPAKGGYVDASGNLYPTTNPNFKPGQTGAITPTFEGYKNLEEQKKFQAYDQQVQQVQQQEELQNAVSQIGLTPQEIAAAQAKATEAPVDLGQAATAGAVGVAPGLLGGIATGIAAGAIGGAAAGTAVAPGVGTVALGAVGAVAGLLVGIKNNIAKQQRGEIASTKKVLTTAKSDMRQLATLASKDPANAAMYIELYDQRLSQVYTAQRKLKLETSGNLNKFMEDGTSELAEFDLFLQPGGTADIYKQKLQMALLSGVPLDFTAEDLASLEG